MRAFTCVVAMGSLTAAAARLETTTANISRMLASLEGHLSIRLLNRTTRRIALTEAGKRYLPRCEQILGLVEIAQAEIQHQQTLPMGRLRIHVMNGLTDSVMPELVSRYRQRYPAVSFELSISRQFPDLIAEGYDMVILRQSAAPHGGGEVQDLGGVHGILCASPGYLAIHGRPRRVHDLQSHTCLALNETLHAEDVWQLFGPKGTCRVALKNVPLRSDSEQALYSAILAGLGIGLLPAYIAARGLQEGSLVQVLECYRADYGRLYAVSPDTRLADARTSSWIAHLVEHLPLLLGDEESSSLCA
ncbi:LysR family transcriptional regulator [Pseudomonas sp. 21LCFQ010]|uniref:LysR family transcriptional regulator n=1 Tax=Pseudomonas sp. 21LCFQ010 TaxID=2957506 RepID=UPI002097CD39|nr:LysR family transcriptional regulator [Pseudomonas sp. 21LCFQ010]MCO8166018.1 LysR family transcriptional regulator [Pseudomonas sp. 21LCFQ010]